MPRSEVIDDRTRAVVFAHAIASFPAEACGFVHASGEVRHARNIATEMHRLDPQRFPRTETTGYVLAPQDVRYLEDNVNSSDPVVALYHSHPNGKAYFSEEDRRAALFDGVPIYPTLHQLVVGVDRTGCQEARLFRFVNGDFVEQEWFPGSTRRGGGG